MVTHSSILGWRIPLAVWSTELQRVGHDLLTFTMPKQNKQKSDHIDRLTQEI